MIQPAPAFAASGIRVVAHDVVQSTNALALALARAGERGSVWVTAERQTAGRGRRGRRWESPAGNLYASLLLTGPCTPERAPQLSFVAALALHDAVSAQVPGAGGRLRLKWPNDLLIDGAKVAGILVEGETLPDGAFSVAIGIGVNCISHPSDTPYPATDLQRAGFASDKAALLRELGSATLRRVAQWRRGDGFGATRSDWLLRTVRLGERMRVRGPQDIHGGFAGIDEQGRLLLTLPDGVLRTFATGDTHFSVPPHGQGSA